MTCALFLDREKFTSLITYIVLVRGNNTNFPLLNFAVALSLNKVRRELGCQFLCVVVKPLNSHDISLPRTSASSPIKREIPTRPLIGAPLKLVTAHQNLLGIAKAQPVS